MINKQTQHVHVQIDAELIFNWKKKHNLFEKGAITDRILQLIKADCNIVEDSRDYKLMAEDLAKCNIDKARMEGLMSELNLKILNLMQSMRNKENISRQQFNEELKKAETETLRMKEGLADEL